MDSKAKLEDTDCEHCDFDWAVKIGDDIVTIASGRLRKVDENNMYDDPAFSMSYGRHVGFFQELPGGRLGQLSKCVELLYPHVEEFEVLVEGRWLRFRI